MKKIILFLAFAFCIARDINAQNLKFTPVVIPTQGGYGGSGNLYFSWTIGEPAQQVKKKGNLKFTEGFQQPNSSVVIQLLIDTLTMPDTLFACETNTFSMRVRNNSSFTQGFAIKIATADTSVANSFQLLHGPHVEDTIVIGGNIYLVSDSFPPHTEDTISYSLTTGCGAIPGPGVSYGNLTFIVGVRDNVMLDSLPVQTFDVNGHGTNVQDTLPSIPFAYPRITNFTTATQNASIAIGGTAALHATYQNSGTGDYNGLIRFSNIFGCSDSLLTVTKIKVTDSGAVLDSIINPTFPCSLQVYIPEDSFFDVEVDVKLNQCLPSQTCNGNLAFAWGCDGNLCRITDVIPFHITQTNTHPNVIVSRILPAANAGTGTSQSAWDASCVNSQTHWEYLIINRGNAAAKEVVANLYSPAVTHTLIEQESIEISVSDPRFVGNGVPVFDTFVYPLSGDSLGIDGPVNCYNSLTGSPVKQFLLYFPELQPGQYAVLKFNTLRCCADDNDYNTGVYYNHWKLNTTYNDCYDSYAANHSPNFPGTAYLLNDTYYSPTDTTPTYRAFQSTNDISTNASDAPVNDLELVQSFQQNTTDITGGQGTCGMEKKFSIRNKIFPNTTGADYDAQLFCNDASMAGLGGGVTGLNVRGQFRVEFSLETGLEMGASPPTITKQGITLTSNYVNSGTIAYAVFDLSGPYTQNGAPVSGIDTNAYIFRSLFFTGSDLNFWIKGCCPGDSDISSPQVTVNTLFNPQINALSCDTCFIPLSQVNFNLQLHCPGCITPGIITDDFQLRRINYGFTDVDDNGIPDGSSLSAITNGYLPLDSLYMNLQGSIAGDTLEGVAEAYLIDGDSSAGFSYSQWQTFWDSANAGGAMPAIEHLYFEEQMLGANGVGLKCIKARFEYFPADSSGPVFYNLPGISGSSPSYPDVHENLLFHVAIDSLGPGVVIQPLDRFRMITTYVVCQNPSAQVDMEINTAMYVTINAITSPAYPYYGGTTTVGDMYETNDTLPGGPINAAGYNPANAALFMCEAFSAVHRVYAIKNTYEEFWFNEASCHQTAVVKGSYYIDGDHPDLFEYEYRPVPGINPQQTSIGPALSDGGPVLFHFGVPAGYAAQLAYSTSTIVVYQNALQTTLIAGLVVPNGFDTTAVLSGPYGYNYRVNTDSAVYSPPFVGVLASAVSIPNSVIKKFSTGGLPCLLLGDERFTQEVLFNLFPICSLHVHPVDTTIVDSIMTISAHVDTVKSDSVYMLIPDYEEGCSGTVQNKKLDDNIEYYLVLPNPSIAANVLTPVLNGQFFDQPVRMTVNGGEVSNLLYYMDIKQNVLPPGIEVVCLSQDTGCTGQNYTPATVINGADTFTRYVLGTMADHSIDTFYLRLSITNCDSLGTTIHIPLYYSWTCDDATGDLPAQANQCDKPDTLLINMSLPKPDLLVLEGPPSGPFSTCTKILYTAELRSQNSGAIGNLFAETVLPSGVVIDTQTVQIVRGGSTFSVNIDSITHYVNSTSTDTLWTIYFQQATGFDTSSAVGENGLQNGERVILKLSVMADCHTDTIPAFEIKIDGQLYCGSTISDAVLNTLFPANIIYTFNAIPITGNGCGPFVTANITGFPCYGSILYTTSLGGYGIPPLDTLWLPFTPNFTQPDTGTYYVTVTDSNECVEKDTVTVHPYFSPVAKGMCDSTGSSILLYIDSLPPDLVFTYLWSNNDTSDTTVVIPTTNVITYTVSVTDTNGCVKTTNREINFLSLRTEKTYIDCNAGVIIYLGIKDSLGNLIDTTYGTPPHRFLWENSLHSIQYPFPIQSNGDSLTYTSTVANNIIPTNLYLQVTDDNGCVAIALEYFDSVGCCVINPDTIIIAIKQDTLSSKLNIPVGGSVYIADNVIFTVDDTLLLQNCEVVLGSHAKIVVQDSAELFLKGTYLHGCDSIWDGIYADPGSRLRTDTAGNVRSKIEDAIKGIVGYSYSGARLFISNTDFSRNQTSITLLAYSPVDSAGYNISGCTFGMGGYSFMLPAPSGFNNYTHPLSGIAMLWTGPIISFPNPAFSNNASNYFADMNTGIFVTISGRINVYDNYFRNIRNYENFSYYGSGAAIRGESISFDGWTEGHMLDVQTAGSAPDEASPVHFSNCDFGVYTDWIKTNIAYNRMDSVTHCVKTINNRNKTWMNENYFTNTNYGITVNNNASTEVQIWGNTIFVNPPTEDFVPTGDSDLTAELNTYGIFETEMNNSIPVNSNIYFNRVWNGRNSIWLNNTNNASVFMNSLHQTSTVDVVGAQAGFYASNCENIAVLADTVTGNATTYYDALGYSPSNTPYHKSGFSFYRSTAEVCNNTADSIGYGIHFVSECNGSNLRNNILGVSKFGVVLKSSGSTAVLGDQGYDLGTSAESHQNVFMGDGSGSHIFNGGYRTFSFINNPIASVYNEPIFYYHGPPVSTNTEFSDSSNALLGGNFSPAASVTAKAITAADSDILTYACASIFFPSPQPWDLLVAGGHGNNYMEDGFDEVGNWLAERRLYNKLSRDTTLLAGDTTLQNFYEDNKSSTLGEIDAYEQALKQLADSTVLSDTSTYKGALDYAKSLHESINYTNTPEENFVRVNTIYLNRLKLLVDTFTTSQLGTLKGIAVQCPYIAGDAVYIARAMLAQTDDRFFFDDIELCSGVSGKRENENSKENAKPIALQENVKVYPNPTNSRLNLSYYALTEGELRFELFNGIGQIVKQEIINQGLNFATFEVSHLPVGLYYWRLKDISRTISTGKVSIVR